MRGRAKRMMGLGVIALNGAAIAQDSDPQSEVDVIVSHLLENVSCDTEDIDEDLKAEIVVLDVARDRALDAFEALSLDGSVCDGLRIASAGLKNFAESEPVAFDQALGFTEIAQAAGFAELAEPTRDAENDVNLIQEKPLRPPQFTLLKTRSSY